MLKNLVIASRRLVAMNPEDPDCDAASADVLSAASKAVDEAPEADKESKEDDSKKDLDLLHDKVKDLYAAAQEPAKAYGRVLAITAGLGRAVEIARRPQNAAIRPRLAKIVEKVAGVFAEIDTVKDLDTTLEQIEKAVHSVYGDQSKNSTFYFDRRGKGHHSQ